MLPMPRDFGRQPLPPSPVQPSESVLSVAKAASLPSTTLTLTFDPGRSMAEHTTSLAVTGSSPSCCCRQRYLLSGGQSAVQHKQGPHQALRRAETRKLRWFLAYSWMCAPHVPVLLQYFCLPLWIVGELQWRWWGSLTPDYYRCEQHTPRASFFLVFGMGELSPGLHTH